MAPPTPKVPDAVQDARDFYNEREGAESRVRSDFSYDLRFCFEPGYQWDQVALSKRQGRPNYTYNRTVGAVNAMVGDQRMIAPSGKVRPTNQKAKLKTAETFGGLIRDIEAQSHAPEVYSEQFKYSAAGGFGFWRVVPEYADDESFDQVLRIRRIPNPLTVMLDQHADPYGRGAMRGLVTERMSKSTYRQIYGNDAAGEFPMTYDSLGWYNDSNVRVAEFYRKIRTTKKLVRLTDGRVFAADKVEAELEALRRAGLTDVEVHGERFVDSWTCEWIKTDGFKILDGPYEYKYRHIPLIRLPGRHVNIEGRDDFQSILRHAKDAAKTYNYNRSSMVETVALTPRAPWILTAKMIEGYEQDWSRANVSNAPYLLYNVDEDSPQLRPERNAAPEVPQAYIAMALHDAEDIKMTLGYTNPALEAQTRAGDAESGRALKARMTMGDSGSYEFLDNFGKAVLFTHEVLIDMIPVVYETKRIERILGTDGRESFVELDPKTLQEGKYDVTVTLGPAQATARMEALDTLLDASERMPIIMEEAPDVIVRNMDISGADEIESRIRMRMIAEGRIQPTPQETEAGIQAPPPDKAKQALVARLVAQANVDQAKAEKLAIENQAAVAQLPIAERRAMLEIAQMVADIIYTQAQAAEKKASAADLGASAMTQGLQPPPTQ